MARLLFDGVASTIANALRRTSGEPDESAGTTASSAGVRNMVLLRRADYDNGKVTVKTLSDGSERSVALDAFLDSL